MTSATIPVLVMGVVMLFLSALAVGLTIKAVQWCYRQIRRKVRRWRVKRILDEFPSEAKGWR